jgi:hypothetical protein
MKESDKKKLDDAIRSVTNTQVISIPQNSAIVYKAPFADVGTDVYWYVSGSKEVKGYQNPNRRVAVFGGDVIISGSLHVEGCELSGSFNFDCDTLELTGSIDVAGTGKFTDSVATSNLITLSGNPFLAAGTGISFSVAGDGQITVSATAGVSNIEWNERLSGVTDGSNTTFSLAYSPASSTAIMVFVNGVLQEAGAFADFTIGGSTITFNNPPPVESKITATYSR